MGSPWWTKKTPCHLNSVSGDGVRYIPSGQLLAARSEALWVSALRHGTIRANMPASPEVRTYYSKPSSDASMTRISGGGSIFAGALDAMEEADATTLRAAASMAGYVQSRGIKDVTDAEGQRERSRGLPADGGRSASVGAAVDRYCILFVCIDRWNCKLSDSPPTHRIT
jgi:hypothetical protein